MNRTELKVGFNDVGKRIDIHASESWKLTRSQIQRLIEKGLLKVNEIPVKANYKTKYGDMLSLEIPEADQALKPEAIPLDILYIDEHIIIVNKPPGMVIYPAAGHSSGTLMNAIASSSEKLASVGGPLRPGVVHRLDKDTSGVMVVALNDSAYYNLVEQFRERTIQRKYQALVYGSLRNVGGEIAAKIGRSESDRKKMSTNVRRGKEAITTWKVIKRFRQAALIEAKLRTGRTHQIRVHFASIGHPVLGDRTYGKKTFIEVGKQKIHFPRQMLHAELLGLIHPATGEYMEFRSDLPEDMQEKILLLEETESNRSQI
jgi:23S rRNA pseudouridine1911/1915/1917 synthase